MIDNNAKANPWFLYMKVDCVKEFFIHVGYEEGLGSVIVGHVICLFLYIRGLTHSCEVYIYHSSEVFIVKSSRFFALT